MTHKNGLDQRLRPLPRIRLNELNVDYTIYMLIIVNKSDFLQFPWFSIVGNIYWNSCLTFNFQKHLLFPSFKGQHHQFETSFISHKSSQRPHVLSISLFYSVSNYMVYDGKKYGILMGIRHIFKSRVNIMGLYLYFCFLTFGA